MNRQEFLTQERDRLGKRSTITIISADVLSWLGGLTKIPDLLIKEIVEFLNKSAGKLAGFKDFRVHAFGNDLHLQINTFGQGIHNQAVQKLAREAIITGLTTAREAGMYQSINNRDIFKLSEAEQVKALNWRVVEFPFTERGAEPLIIAKIINGGIGAFNRMLFNMFFHPDKGSHQRLDGARYMALVENVQSLQAGETRRRIFIFGDRPLEDKLFLIYPFASEPLEFDREQVGDWGELLSLIANPSEWVISAIYAAQGRFVHDGKNWKATRHEPVVVVSVEPSSAGVYVKDPVAVVRLQSGLPAVGEGQLNLGADFHYVPGGPEGGYHVGVMPVTLEQARTRVDEPGTARLVAYTYQSFDNGRIPPDHDVIDIYAQDTLQTEWLQQEAREYIDLIVQHGEFQPYLTAEEAEKRALAKAEQLKEFFEAIPSAEKGEVDPLVEKANQRADGETISDIKADAGGKVGHTSPTTLFQHVARASLTEAREQGLIRDFEVFAVGDDLHLLMHHKQGIDANEVHVFAFKTFWRMVWVTEIIGYKPYGLAQDLKIGPATKGKGVDELAQPTSRFLTLLNEYLPEAERAYMEQIRAEFAAWEKGAASMEIKKPFAGNVTGQGPGFAELPLVHGKSCRVGIFAADKAGPAAFNVPVYRSAMQVLYEEKFCSKYGESLAFEIYDVHNHTRIFLDAHAHRQDIETLLGATNLFNVKRIWSLPQSVSDRKKVKEAVQDILLAASTEKLSIITGGEYVGKDDPVLIGVEELVMPIFEFMKTGFYMTQGDERGSHYMMLVPKPLPEAVATVRSRGLQVGLLVALNEKGIAELHDVYAEPSFHEARIRIDKINARIWRAQGSEFTPVGVGAKDVEPAYPLMKVLNRITREDSPYARTFESASKKIFG